MTRVKPLSAATRVSAVQATRASQADRFAFARIFGERCPVVLGSGGLFDSDGTKGAGSTATVIWRRYLLAGFGTKSRQASWRSAGPRGTEFDKRAACRGQHLSL